MVQDMVHLFWIGIDSRRIRRPQGLLAKHGVKDLPIRLKVGRQNPHEHRGFGLMHTLKHFDDMVNIRESPLLHLYNSLHSFFKNRRAI